MNTLENSLEEALTLLDRIFRPECVFVGLLFIAGLVSILLLNFGALPVSWPYALFYFSLLVLFGLYRPKLVWQALVFFLPFELLVLTTVPGGMDIRVYQFGMAALLVATLVLWLQQKVSLPRFKWFDAALALLLLGAVVTFFARSLPTENLKDVIILFSFGALYALGRVYLHKKSEVHTFLATLLASGVAVSLYAIYQAVAFQKHWADFMVMAGRPNGVLEEADWLGYFVGFAALITLVGALKTKQWYQELGFALLLTLFLTTLILTVSRSAWLGLAVGVGVMGLVLAYDFVTGFIQTRLQDVRTIFKFFIGLPLVLAIAIGIVFIFSLTRFDLDQRLTSTGGEQVITIACPKDAKPPAMITQDAELTQYGCTHINLEEITGYQSEGYLVTEIERPDPNITIRKNLYQETWNILQEHFFLGLGWGESVKAFGTDERGAGLNSSNVFLEVWLGSGLMGIVGFLFFWFGILAAVINRLAHKREMTEGFWFTMLMLGLWFQVTVFNLFNAGILLGTFIAFLMLAAWYGEKTVPYSITSLWRK